jgi:hypothetical protein
LELSVSSNCIVSAQKRTHTGNPNRGGWKRMFFVFSKFHLQISRGTLRKVPACCTIVLFTVDMYLDNGGRVSVSQPEVSGVFSPVDFASHFISRSAAGAFLCNTKYTQVNW